MIILSEIQMKNHSKKSVRRTQVRRRDSTTRRKVTQCAKNIIDDFQEKIVPIYTKFNCYSAE